jgi:hypothetical protein
MLGNVDFIPSLSGDAMLVCIDTMIGGDIVASKIMEAEELSTFIKNLGKLRADMAQEVNRKLEQNPVFTDVTRGAIFHVNRQHKIGKEFFIAARHEGFGWLAFSLGAGTGSVLAAMILKQIDDMQGNIIKPKGGLIV